MTPPSEIVTLLAQSAAKASLVFGAAFVVTALLRRRASAATRHLVWLAAFAGVLVLPFASAALPPLDVPLPEAFRTPTAPPVDVVEMPALASRAPMAVTESVPDTVYVVSAGGRAGVVAPAVAEGPVTIASYSVSYDAPAASAVPATWSARLVLLWLFGCVMVAVAFAVGVLRTHILACQATPAIDDTLAEEAEVLSASLGIVRDVRVMTWDGPTMPMTWGALRPVVLLPASARQWPEARRREVLTHELAHVSRGDWAARILAALVCALQWFNPLAWMAARRLRDEQELACDDAVLAGGAQPSAYAAHLLEVARSLRSPVFGVTSASVAMARPSQLTGRLLAMLDASRQRTPRAFSVWMVWALMGGIVIPVAALRGTEAGTQATAAASTAPLAPVFDVVSAGPIAAPAASTVQQRCDGNTRRRAGRTSTHNSSDGEGASSSVNLLISENGCQIEVKIRGPVRFSDDETGVAEVPQGGSVRVTQDDGSVEKRFDVSWRGGQLQRRWTTDGREVAESAEQRAWLAWALQTAFTRTGFNVVPRTLRAYRAGGLDSALRLAEATNSDYARRLVAMALIDSVPVPPAEAARVAHLADRMSSDYERAELLIAVAQQLRLDGSVQDAMVSVAGQMSSDFERGRVLTAALARPDLSPEAARGLLAVAAHMSSDYEKTELLIRFLRARPFDESRRAAFFSAASSISSDYEKRRLLSEVVSRVQTPGAVIADVASASASLSSNYERAELLVQIGRKFGANADVRARVTRSAEGISSDYERSRVMAVLPRTTY